MKKIVFVCSPSAGLLDMWLPLLFHLRVRLPATEMIFLDPTRKSVAQLSPEEHSFRIANEIFDTVLVRAERANWFTYSSLIKARNSGDRMPPTPGTRNLKWRGQLRRIIVQLGLLKLAQKLRSKIDRAIFKSSKYTQAVSELVGNQSSSGVLLFDLSEVDKPYLADVIRTAQFWPKFSLLHGISPRGLRGDVRKDSGVNFGPDQTTALLFSADESDFYVKQYGLRKTNLSITGIPRHSTDWVSRLLSWEASNFAPPEEGFIFLISRGVGGALSQERKTEAAKEVLAAAVKYGLSVIIRLHPTEEADGIYERVFGLQEGGVTWSLTNEHPLVLASHCIFAVTFVSGVSLDVVRQGAPVIELNWSGKIRNDKRRFPPPPPHSRRVTPSPEAVSPYRVLGVVLGASDSKPFMEQVDFVMSDRARAVTMLQREYSRVFGAPDDKVEESVSQIATAFEETQGSE